MADISREEAKLLETLNYNSEIKSSIKFLQSGQSQDWNEKEVQMASQQIRDDRPVDPKKFKCEVC